MSAVKFTAFEQKILDVLQARAGNICSRSVLTDHLYAHKGYTKGVYSNTLEVFIRRIRAKLPKDKKIRTVWRRGYVLEKIPMCDVCSVEPGTIKLTAAAGTDTLACQKCLLNINSQEFQQ